MICRILVFATAPVAIVASPLLDDWLSNFGHDLYHYPEWITQQMQSCTCEVSLDTQRNVHCQEKGSVVHWNDADALTWCVAKHFLLTQMPEFDLHFLPPSVSIEGTSMLDDNIAFALMAWNASALAPQPPLRVALSYLLPYAAYQEARNNWRPLFFAKYMQVALNLTTSVEVVDALIKGKSPHKPGMMNWTNYKWKSFPGAATNNYELGPFAGGTAPPVVGPFDFLAYGYGSCTAWSTFLTSALKAVGVPARQVGSPCWNDGDFKGLATANPNISKCWNGGPPGGPYGGQYLYNHNWVEYWDNEAAEWRFLDVASTSSAENTWFCGKYDGTGCECSSRAGKAAPDHDVFAVTWSPVVGSSGSVDGGSVLDVGKDLKLSTGEAVSPLAWSSRLTSPLGTPLKNVGLRLVNRTAFYRCKKEAPEEFLHIDI